MAVEIPERKGSFLRFCEVLGRRNVTEFNYRYDDGAAAQLFVGLALAEGRKEKEALLASLREAGYPVVDMTDNEMAKLHVRYMVGGHGARHRARAAVPLRVPGAPGRAAEVPATRSARSGTSRCSTIAITARITAACSRACRCRRKRASTSICTCAS